MIISIFLYFSCSPKPIKGLGNKLILYDFGEYSIIINEESPDYSIESCINSIFILHFMTNPYLPGLLKHELMHI